MSDKQVVITIVGGFLFVGLFQRDGGDDGFGMIWIFLSVVCGIVGLVLSAKWARKHYPEESR